MSQSIRSGKPAAPLMSLADCFSAVVDALQGQKPRRASKGLHALTGFEEHFRSDRERIANLKDTIDLQKHIIADLKQEVVTVLQHNRELWWNLNGAELPRRHPEHGFEAGSEEDMTESENHVLQ